MSVNPIVTDFLEERLSPISSALTPDTETQILLKTRSPEEAPKNSNRYGILGRSDSFGEKSTVQWSPLRKNVRIT